MPQLQVKVNKLNIRKNPVKDFADKGNVVGVLHKDAVFESVGTITNELGTWHVDGDGNWASERWLGASFDFVTNTQWWYKKLQINKIQQLADSFGNETEVTVAILDTGIVSDLIERNVFNVIGRQNFIDNSNNVIDISNGHGTLCASLIAASDEVFGSINPQAKIFIAKTFEVDNATNEVVIANAINTLCNSSTKPKIDIISISGGIPDVDVASSPLADAVNEAKNQSVIISAAIGNILQTSTGCYPALFSSVFSIGALDQNYQYSTMLNPTTSKIDYLMPGEKVNSINLFDSKTEIDGTSHACAIMSGILSLIVKIVKAKKLKWAVEDFRSFLDLCSDKVNSNGHFFNRINPDLLIENLKKI